MKKNIYTTSNEEFTVNIPHYQPSQQDIDNIINTIEDCVSSEELAERENTLRKSVATVNDAFKTLAFQHAMFSDDVIRTLCNGVHFAKITIEKQGDAFNLSCADAHRRMKVKVVDKTPVYENRPDFVQYTDVIRQQKAYNAELAKAGYKSGYELLGNINARQFDLLTVFAHNLAGKITEKDLRTLEKLGDTFVKFASTSKNSRKWCVQFFYDLFNAHTGKQYKAIEFIVDELCNDKRLATFDSKYYTSTVPSEYTLLSVLMSHYVNTGVSVFNNSKAKKLGDMVANIAVTAPSAEPTPSAEPAGIALDVQEDVPSVAVIIEPPCISDNRAMEYTASARKAYADHIENCTELPSNISYTTAENGDVVITYNR